MKYFIIGIIILSCSPAFADNDYERELALKNQLWEMKNQIKELQDDRDLEIAAHMQDEQRQRNEEYNRAMQENTQQVNNALNNRAPSLREIELQSRTEELEGDVDAIRERQIQIDNGLSWIGKNGD